MMIRRLSLSLLLLLLTILGSGCPDVELAIERCETLQDRYCSRVDDCNLLLSRDRCLSEVRQNIDCGDAVDTTDDYDRCIDDIDTAACSSLDELPASCRGVILVTE